MSRRSTAIVVSFFAMFLPSLASAQSSNIDEAIAASDALYGPPPPVEECTEEQEAAIISGEILVCRRIVDQSTYRISTEDEAESRYAEETMDQGAPRAPDVSGPGIFKGEPTVSGLCFIPPCPKPPALIIDLDAIPEAPPGSDADRVGKGLAPRGNDLGEQSSPPAIREKTVEEGEKPED